jgi:group I intron endonuclease
MIIYKTTNLINGKIYIGQDSKNNPEYFGSGILLNRAIEKYGKENFIKEILEQCSTKDELNIREKYWINYYDAKNNGYNIADGGHGGNTYTEETKKRVSDMLKNKQVSDETKAKISWTLKGRNTLEWFINKYGEEIGTERYNQRCKDVGNFHRNKTISEDQKKKLSERMKTFDNYSQEFLHEQKRDKTAENSPMWGKKHSEETKRKMSDSHKKNPIKYWLGKKQSEESNEKRRQKSLNFKHTDAHKKSISGEGNPFYGCKHTDESRRKISEARKSKTPEQKLERYIKFFISRTGKEPSNVQKQLKLEDYRSI